MDYWKAGFQIVKVFQHSTFPIGPARSRLAMAGRAKFLTYNSQMECK
jgi:hypothetical protein